MLNRLRDINFDIMHLESNDLLSSSIGSKE
jgi:hypothetical protein